MGHFHRQCPCILQRDCPHALACPCYTGPANVLGNRQYRRRCCHLQVQHQARHCCLQVCIVVIYDLSMPSADGSRIPLALQWMFPTPLAILMFLAPESPWWLVRKGRLDQAARSVERLGRKSRLNAGEVVAMMRRVIDLETSTSAPGYIELFRKTDLRRTLIVCGIYGAQNLAGNLIANQAVYFFERTLWLHQGELLC